MNFSTPSSSMCSSFLDIIEDPPSSESPHRAAAMELIFDKAIDDSRERVFAWVDKSPPVDPTAQPNSSGKETPLFSASTRSTVVIWVFEGYGGTLYTWSFQVSGKKACPMCKKVPA